VNFVVTGFVGILCLNVIIGWLNGAEFGTVTRGEANMKLNTAICLLLCSFLAVQFVQKLTNRWVFNIVAALIALIPLATLYEYIANVDLHIDQIIVVDRTTSNVNIPGRMSIISIFLFLLFLTAAYTATAINNLFAWIGRLSITMGTMLSLNICVGYLIEVSFFYKLTPGSSIAFVTALSFLALFASLAITRTYTLAANKSA
jgi:hypothetical protein